MAVCRTCKKDIAQARYVLLGEQVYKSCPECSKRVGEHVFYPCPEDFGMTKKRMTDNNPLGLQSHCTKCRGNNKGPHSHAVNCSELTENRGYMISEVRFLPMSSGIFAEYEDARNFILYGLPDKGGIYYFMKSKMDCAQNAFVLFQYGGSLIGYAVYDDMVILDEPIHDGDSVYTGYYIFKSDSVRLFKQPITADTFKKIDRHFKSFNQSHQRMPVGFLPAIFACIKDGNKVIMRSDDTAVLPEEISEADSQGLKEGQKKQIVVNAYERSPEARNRCLKYYKKRNGGRIRCEICGFDFGEVYGDEFAGKIHIHHLKEIASIGEEYEIDAEHDLIPICPNCHMVAHSRKPAITPEEIRNLLMRRRQLAEAEHEV